MVNNAKGGLEIVLLSYWKERVYVSAKQDRQGVRTASDLEQKYNFDKTFAELMGIATDARNKVDSVESTLRDEIKKQYTSISRDTEKIVMEALEEYVKTGDLEEYKRTVQSQFKVMADSISSTISSSEETIKEYLDEEISKLDQYVKTSNAELVVKDNEIHAKAQENEQRYIELRDNLTDQVKEYEEFKKETTGELTVTNEMMHANMKSSLDHISVVQGNVDVLSDGLADQADEIRKTTEKYESDLELLAEQMNLSFQATTEQFTSIDGEVQSVKEELEKHFEFSTDGLIIKAGENSMELHLDNDLIRFTRNGQEFGWWDGVDFYTGNVVVAVSERAQFGNFAFVPRSNGSLDFLKVDEYTALAITSHPQNKTVTGTYQSASFSVTATGDGLTYQWQTSTDGETWTNMANGTSSSINVMYTTTDIKKRYYRCVVTDKRRKKVTSNVATFTLNA